MSASGRRIQSVIFDLDGTLTEPTLDFEVIRSEIGIAPGLPILEALEGAGEAERARAEEILRRHEREAIARARLADGCAELLAHLSALAIPTSILTRNMREAVETFARMFGFSFHATWAREDGPPKPSPAGVLHLCERMGAPPADTLVVGDYKYDIVAGVRAGARTALVTTRALTEAELPEWGPPHFIVRSLRELLPLF